MNSDRDEITKALEVLTERGQTIELRAIGVVDKPGSKPRRDVTVSDDRDALADRALMLDGKATGIYITLNPVHPGVVGSARDEDIVCRRWFPIDIDPARETGTSATNEEHQGASQVAERIRAFLTRKGWPEPIQADSGNGAHLLYPIDLPNDNASRLLVTRAIQALDFLFSNEHQNVDTTVFNAARIWKLYGTIARKGESTPERPHRIARLTHAPKRFVVVTREQLEELTAYLPNKTDAVRGEKQVNGKALDIDAFIEEHGIEVERVKQQDGCTVHRLMECPWNEAHSDGCVDGAAIIRYDNGALQFKCHHNHCQDKKWQDFRVFYEQDAYRRDVEGQPQHTQGQIYTGRELMGMTFKATQWAVEGVLPEGAYLLAGKPKQGKSWMAFGLALAVAAGGMALGKVAVDSGDVLYLALEDNQRRMQARARQILGDELMPSGLYIAHDWPRSDAGGIELIEKWLEAHPDARLIIVDTLAKTRPPASRNGVYADDYAAVEPFQKLSARHQVTILLITHTRKMAADDDQDEISGSTGLTGAADGSLVLKRVRGQDEATLTLRGRDVEEKSLALKFDGTRGTWNLMGDATAYQMTEMQRKIRAAIEEAGGKATPKQVADLTGCDYNNIKQAMYKMSKRNLLSVEGRGVYSINNPTNFDNQDNRDNFDNLPEPTPRLSSTPKVISDESPKITLFSGKIATPDPKVIKVIEVSESAPTTTRTCADCRKPNPKSPGRDRILRCADCHMKKFTRVPHSVGKTDDDDDGLPNFDSVPAIDDFEDTPY